jgi:succinoglycan biosynthesis transport protein ExoP
MLLEPLSGAAEAYRSIRNRLLSELTGDKAEVIFVASAAQRDGAELVAANAAISLAQAGHQTLLVDADANQPLVHQIFGVGNEEGLSEVLRGGVPSITHPVRDITSLSLLTAGIRTASSSDELASDHFLKLLEILKSKYQYIVISGAPLLSSSDSMLLAKRVAEVLLVAQPETTQLRTLSKTRSVLNQMGANVVGIVLKEGSK